MKDPVEWQKDLAICNKTCNEIMDKFFDKLLESKVELPRSSEIFTTRSVISRANKETEDGEETRDVQLK